MKIDDIFKQNLALIPISISQWGTYGRMFHHFLYLYGEGERAQGQGQK